MAEPESNEQGGSEADGTSSSPKPSALVLRRLLYAMMVGDPSWADDRLDFILTIGKSDNSDVNGRVWWRIPRLVNDPEGWEPGYVSLNPGEFRGKRPDGPHDIVREAPVSSHPQRLSTLLEGQLRLLEARADELNEDLKSLKLQAERLLRNMRANNYSEGLNIFREETLKLRTGQPESAQDVVNGLYENCLFNFLLPGSTFAMAMALLQIQMGLNLWIEQDVYDDIRSFLGSFLGITARSYPAILEGAVKIGNWHFEDGRKSLREALSSVSLDSFYRQLYVAAHHFWAACAVAKDSQEIMPASRLNYTMLIAEESYSCVITGLNSELIEFTHGDRDGFEKELIYYLESNQENQAQKTLSDLTRPTNPILPKHYARVSMARAMIQSGDKWVQKGIEMLHSLEEEFHSRSTIFENARSELFRIESALMVGYREIGDEEHSMRYATKIAGRAIVDMSFGNS